MYIVSLTQPYHPAFLLVVSDMDNNAGGSFCHINVSSNFS